MLLKSFSFFVLLLGSFLFGQPLNDNLVSFSLASIDNSDRFSLGYMKKINPEMWLGVDLGYGIQSIFPQKEGISNYKSFEIRPELYFPLGENPESNHLFSVSTYYINRKMTLQNSNYTEENRIYSFTQADYSKTRFGVMANYTYLVHFVKNKFGIAPKVGMGINRVNIGFNNVSHLQEVESSIFSYILRPLFMQKGNHIRFAFYYDIRLFFRF